jgi:hypothetical protein
MAASCSMTGTRQACGEDFRIDNSVFVGNQTVPDSRGTTIFYGGLVYDFLDAPAEVTVFDKAGGRFILLDLDRRLRSELTTGEVDGFVARIQQRTAAHTDPMVNFLGAPRFEEKYDPNTGELALTSMWMSYRVRLQPAEMAVTQQYREFSDWQVRLNTVLSPGGRPPFARLALNEAIARHQATACEVHLTLTLKPNSPSKQMIVRSQHVLSALAADDVGRVNRIGEFMRSFQPVAFDQYRKGK